MNESLRQTRALLQLVWRHWTRRAIKMGAAPTQQRIPAGLILTLVWCAYMSQAIWKVADRCAHLSVNRLAGTSYQLWALLLFGIAGGFADAAPELGKLRSPLKAALLDELPIGWGARLLLMWLRNAIVAGLFLVICEALALGQRRSPAIVLYSLGLYLAFFLVGSALASIIRGSVSSHVRGRILQSWTVLSLLGYVVLMGGPMLAKKVPRPIFRRDPLLVLARPLAQQDNWIFAVALLAILALVSLLIISAVEAHGYDRLDMTPPKRQSRSQGILDLRSLERRLMWREGGTVATPVLALAGFVGLTIAAFKVDIKADQLSGILTGGFTFIAYMGGIGVFGVAQQATARELSARPFLSALPISPADTLVGKISALRLYSAPWLLYLIPAAIATARADGADVNEAWMLVWHAAVAIAAVWLACHAVASVAFLGAGAGQSLVGGPKNFDMMLLLMPLLAATAAQSLPLALPPLAGLAALAFEARRSAARSIRWIDDSAEDAERDTPVWRALVVLAVFFALQSLGSQLLSLLPFQFGPGYALAAVYGTSALVLALLTVRSRPSTALRFLPANPIWLGAGVLGGAASAMLSLGFIKLLHLGSGGDAGAANMSPGELLALAITMVLFAPIAEEIFFRGWLQDVITRELPEKQRRWGFLIAAFAFGVSHVGSPFVPQFLLGLVAGALYLATGSLLPGMVAHFVHNAMAMGF